MADLPTSCAQPSKARYHADQPELALSGLLATRAGVVAPEDNDTSDDDDEHLSNTGDEPLSSKKDNPWLQAMALNTSPISAQNPGGSERTLVSKVAT